MLPKPTAKYIQSRIRKFENTPRYHEADATVELVFRQWPENKVFEQVLAKVVVLNRLYSTNIFDVYTVAYHIVDAHIDEALVAGDPAAMDKVGWIKWGKKHRWLFSFATKYCSFHQPNCFQIFDSYVEWLLWEYQKQFQFSGFHRYELRDYPRFLQVVADLKTTFNLNDFTCKEIDKFLWIEGMQQAG